MMDITNISVAKQHGDRDRVLTADNGTKTERRVNVNNIEITIVATNAQTENNGPNDRDEYHVTFRTALAHGVVERMRLDSQNGRTYTFKKVE